MNLPGYNFDGDFEFFAKAFLDGTTEYGSYWTMLKVHTRIIKLYQKSTLHIYRVLGSKKITRT